MLTKEQRIEIDMLREDEWNVSEIAKKMNLDWKTVKRCVSQQSQANMGAPSGDNKQLDENELTKVIFQKLNGGIPPEKIAEEVGYVDLVASLYQKRKNLRGLSKSDSSLPDPKMLESFEAWENSFEKYQEWHLGSAIRALGENGYQRMIVCPNYKKKGIECYQKENDDPYMCIGCIFFPF